MHLKNHLMRASKPFSDIGEIFQSGALPVLMVMLRFGTIVTVLETQQTYCSCTGKYEFFFFIFIFAVQLSVNLMKCFLFSFFVFQCDKSG